MNKAYIIAPLVALAAFIPFYLNFYGGYVEAEKAEKEAIRAAAEQKLRDEQAARVKAIEDANAINEVRKQEKAERDAKDLMEKEARQAAIDARDASFNERNRLSKEADQLAEEVAGLKAEIVDIDSRQEHYRKEIAHLRQYVPQSEENAKALRQRLLDIQAADAARAEADRLAAAAAAAAAKSR